jgi:hypothetical protein
LLNGPDVSGLSFDLAHIDQELPPITAQAAGPKAATE